MNKVKKKFFLHFYIFIYLLIYLLFIFQFIVYPAMTKFLEQHPEVFKSGYDDYKGKNIPCFEVNIIDLFKIFFL